VVGETTTLYEQPQSNRACTLHVLLLWQYLGNEEGVNSICHFQIFYQKEKHQVFKIIGNTCNRIQYISFIPINLLSEAMLCIYMRSLNQLKSMLLLHIVIL
jgi:hypothetical protein